MSEPSHPLRHWWIPAAVLVVALAALVGLRAVLQAEDPLPWGPDAPESAVTDAVAAAPADPFRYGGRPLGTVLAQFGPGGPDWRDAGWQVKPRSGGGYRVARRFVAPGGAERVFRFSVSADLTDVRPANAPARALMLIGPGPE